LIYIHFNILKSIKKVTIYLKQCILKQKKISNKTMELVKLKFSEESIGAKV